MMITSKGVSFAEGSVFQMQDCDYRSHSNAWLQSGALQKPQCQCALGLHYIGYTDSPVIGFETLPIISTEHSTPLTTSKGRSEAVSTKHYSLLIKQKQKRINLC